MSRPLDGVPYTLPAPTGGWNARDSLPTMPSNDAVKLENLFPDTTGVKKRAGSRRWAHGVGADLVETLAPFSEADGTVSLVATGNLLGTKDLYLLGSTADSTATAIGHVNTEPTLTEVRCQYVQFNHHLIFVNGTDTPFYVRDSSGPKWSEENSSGTDSFTAPAGKTLTDAISISAYKNRVYIIPKDSLEFWYGGVESTAGALVSFDVSSLFNLGGFLLFAGSSSYRFGDSIQDVFVIVSSEGEIIAYQGDYPGSSTWTVAGHYYIPKPLGRRSFFPMGNDLQIITERGVIPLSAVVGGEESAGVYNTLSQKIDKAFISAARSYGAFDGWEGINYTRGNYALVNIPVQDGAVFEQYVVNTINGSWCKFTGQKAGTWCVADKKLYYGSNSGYVFEADFGINDRTNASSDGVSIDIEALQAYSGFGSPQVEKQVTAIRPLMVGSETNMELSTGVNVDFEDGYLATTSVTGGSGTLWDEGVWDVSLWAGAGVVSKRWYSINSNVGRFFAIRMKAEILDAELEWYATDILHKKGGVL